MDKSVRDAGGRKDGALRRQILRKRERRDGQKESFLFATKALADSVDFWR